MMDLIRRLGYLLNRNRLERELANDMAFHREMAAREGRQNFGNDLHLREEARDAWGWTWIDRSLQDVRYAVRMLRKSPGFTLAAVLMLAIGIGVNVAAFAFFDLMVLRPMNVRDPATLVRFHRRSPDRYAFALPYPEMAFFRKHAKTLSTVLAMNSTRLSIEGEERQVEAHFVTGNFFAELGAAARLGRTFDPAHDDLPGAAPVVVLSEAFWQRHFGGDPLVLGRILYLNGQPATVIGVAAREFSGLSLNEPALWAPLTRQPYFAAGSHLLTDFSVESSGVQMWGRPQPGLSPKAAEEELASLAAKLRKQQPDHIWEKEALPSEPGAFASSLIAGNQRGSGTEGRGALYPIFAMIGALVLLILAVACANLGSLLLARGVAREREVAIRVAVGAGSGRLVRQLFTESLLLALLGSAAGLFLGSLVLRSLLLVSGVPVWLDPKPDWRIMLFAIGMGCGASILFGLTPALQTARRRHRNTTRQFLVGAQVAASCVLLIVAALLGRAVNHALSSDPGFDYQHVIAIDPGLGKHGYTAEKARAYLDTLAIRLRALPGVEAVALTRTPPLGNGSITTGATFAGRSVDVQMNYIGPGFFETMKIPLLRGRNLARGEAHAIIVSDSLARGAWPGQDPLGKKFSIGEDFTVVGVARSARLIKLENTDSVEVYLPAATADLPSMSMVVRTAGPPEDLARAAASTARALASDAYPEVQLLKSGFRRKLQGAEYSAMAVSVLGVVADLLACLGIVGVVSFAVSQRTREIGIRMALGARPAHVLHVVLRQFLLPVLAGLVTGVPAAALSKLLRGQLYGISNLDPATYSTAIGLFLVTVVAAAVFPARRALRIDPLRALRND